MTDDNAFLEVSPKHSNTNNMTQSAFPGKIPETIKV